MNYERIYAYRFKGVDLVKKNAIWTEIAQFMHQKLGSPERLLDPASGMCEFINHSPATEKWAVDLNAHFLDTHASAGVKKVVGDNLTLDLPPDYFDAVFVSNFLEHLHSQKEVAAFLEKMHSVLQKGGKIAVMGPNFKYVTKQYFDFADHTVILSELGVAEHLYGAGFDKMEIYPRFLPLSFRGKLPVNRFLARMYLRMPFAWPFFGKQFLLIAEK